MREIVEEDFSRNLFTLLRETFEGPPPKTASAYLDQGGGLLQTLSNLTAEQASRCGAPGAPTIAAHCEHARFYLDVLDRYMKGPLGEIDWKQSWTKQIVGISEWEQLKQDLTRAYETVTTTLQSVVSWEDKTIGGGMAIITHTAYHLGAIRQLLRLVAP